MGTSESKPGGAYSNLGPNAGYVDDLYTLYQKDPKLVGPTWSQFFESGASLPVNGNSSPQNGSNGAAPTHTVSAPTPGDDILGERVYRMVSAYRNRAHLKAKINPIENTPIQPPAADDVNIPFYNFTQEQLGQTIACAGFKGEEFMLLGQLVTELELVYCNTIGFEFGHLLSQEERLWLQRRIERRFEEGYRLSEEQRIRALKKIIEAEAFESALHKKYVGHKRFSLQGAETIIPMLSIVLERAPSRGVRDIILGMAHRGRLNVLRNVLGKPLVELLTEFNDQNIFSALGSGDVKYHMGFESSYETPEGEKVNLTLVPNPSHLEFVGPVVEGIARAKQDVLYDHRRDSVLPVLIHGDAAFIGQGVVPEMLNMSLVDGYSTGGTVHLIINNQVGFTTGPEESRSSYYTTDFAKAVQAPIFHVNGEDIESCCWATKTALDFSNRFGRDVVLDLYCYRKYGHNEGDDPSFTQPIIYREINEKKPLSNVYGEALAEEGVISADTVDNHFEECYAEFDTAHQATQNNAPIGEACPVHGRLRVPNPDTGVSKSRLDTIARSLTEYPESFTVHPKLHRILEKRIESVVSEKDIEWGMAEILAYGSLVQEGVSVRLSGQDCGRGTFSQRHARLVDYETGASHFPLETLAQNAHFEVLNSTLSEAAVLGFEFGYSAEAKNALVLWEAQFGDFANGAQVIIDQFIAASEQKWDQLSGIVLLLPHGYEGQGPEHSSARLERYLQLCADGNMVVAYPSTAAQYFHLLRRQGLMEIKRPLVVMTPKSLLRSNRAACLTSDLTTGQFQNVMEENFGSGDVEHVVFCSGKVYYDLADHLQARVEGDAPDYGAVKVVRVEQLYPFPQFELKRALRDVDAKSYAWVQEEPHNMGAWSYIEPALRGRLNLDVQYAGRPASASTATGSSRRHSVEQKDIFAQLENIHQLHSEGRDE